LNKSSSENYIQEYKNLLNDINNKIVQNTIHEMDKFYFQYISYKRDSNILKVLHNKYLTHYPEHLQKINKIYNLSQQQLENELDNIKKTQEKRDKERTEAREKEEKLFQESYELFGIKGHKET
jgi:acetyl-CoA carboxylase alpha subunit